MIWLKKKIQFHNLGWGLVIWTVKKLKTIFFSFQMWSPVRRLSFLLPDCWWWWRCRSGWSVRETDGRNFSSSSLLFFSLSQVTQKLRCKQRGYKRGPHRKTVEQKHVNPKECTSSLKFVYIQHHGPPIFPLPWIFNPCKSIENNWKNIWVFWAFLMSATILFKTCSILFFIGQNRYLGFNKVLLFSGLILFVGKVVYISVFKVRPFYFGL